MNVLLSTACISPEGHFVIEFPKHLIIKANGPLRGLHCLSTFIVSHFSESQRHSHQSHTDFAQLTSSTDQSMTEAVILTLS